MLPPFVDPTWRGCILYRDAYELTMPQVLFDAIVAAAAPSELRIARYTPVYPELEALAPDWAELRQRLRYSDNFSLEFVMFDVSEQWALLADLNATVFGAAPELAARVDACLAKQGTSLVKMTDDEFGVLDPATQPGARYYLAVTGRTLPR